MVTRSSAALGAALSLQDRQNEVLGRSVVTRSSAAFRAMLSLEVGADSVVGDDHEGDGDVREGDGDSRGNRL